MAAILYEHHDAEEIPIHRGDIVRHHVDGDTGTVIDLVDPAADDPTREAAKHPFVRVLWSGQALTMRHFGDELTIIERDGVNVDPYA